MPSRKRKRQTVGPDASWAQKVCITPAKATEWLESNTANRPPSKQAVNALDRIIRRDEWVVNGETIKFDTNGVLRDGQTRLAGIVKAGKSVWCWVIFDIQQGYEPFETIDLVRVRTLGQFLAIREYLNYNHLATAIGLVYQVCDQIEAEPGGFCKSLGLRIIEQHPGIADSLAKVMTEGIRETYSPGYAAGLHYVMGLKSAALSDKFWSQIASGGATGSRNPVRAIRDAMVRNKHASKDNKISGTGMLARTIKAWNFFCVSKSCQVLKWNPEKEEFPVIE